MTKVWNRSLVIIVWITLMTALGITSIPPALPVIAEHFKISGDKSQLLMVFFALPGIILTPTLGILADIYGRKRILAPSLFLFGVAGVACFFASTFEQLLVFRFLQGVGSASLGALNVTLIGDLYDGESRTKIMGYNNSILSIGTGFFPIIGGILADKSWNFPFLLPLVAVPIGFAVIYALDSRYIPSHKPFLTSVKEMFECLKNPTLVYLFVISLLTFMVLLGSFIPFLPFFMKAHFGVNSKTIGMFLASMSLFAGIMSSQLGRLVKYVSNKKIFYFSLSAYTIALLILPSITNMYSVFFATVIFGLGHGVHLPNIQAWIVSIVPAQQRGGVMSFNRMVAQLGQTVGPFLFGLVYSLYGSSIHSINLVFWLGAALSFLILVFVIFTLKENRIG